MGAISILHICQNMTICTNEIHNNSQYIRTLNAFNSLMFVCDCIVSYNRDIFSQLKRWQQLNWSAWASFTPLFSCRFLSLFFPSLRFIQRHWTNELNSGWIFGKWDTRDAGFIVHLQCQCCSAQLHFTNCHFIWHLNGKHILTLLHNTSLCQNLNFFFLFLCTMQMVFTFSLYIFESQSQFEYRFFFFKSFSRFFLSLPLYLYIFVSFKNRIINLNHMIQHVPFRQSRF